MKKIILASRSKDREELLKLIKIPFVGIFSKVDEEFYKTKFSNPYKLVQELAKAKAIDIKNKFNKNDSDALVIAADTIVEIDGIIIGKPVNKEHAFEILNKLNNRAHNLITGLAVTEISTPKLVSDYDKTIVHFSYITNDEIKSYLETNEWKDRAGAYSIKDKAALFINSIQGSYSNVIGLPLNKLFKICKEEFNFNLLKLNNL
ncbi:MAG: nucleoside triphosphate pyrophosphatase [Candidatus Thorarchaeota archaeon]